MPTSHPPGLPLPVWGRNSTGFLYTVVYQIRLLSRTLRHRTIMSVMLNVCKNKNSLNVYLLAVFSECLHLLWWNSFIFPDMPFSTSPVTRVKCSDYCKVKFVHFMCFLNNVSTICIISRSDYLHSGLSYQMAAILAVFWSCFINLAIFVCVCVCARARVCVCVNLTKCLFLAPVSVNVSDHAPPISPRYSTSLKVTALAKTRYSLTLRDLIWMFQIF